MKVLLDSFRLNGHILGFHSDTTRFIVKKKQSGKAIMFPFIVTPTAAMCKSFPVQYQPLLCAKQDSIALQLVTRYMALNSVTQTNKFTDEVLCFR